MKRFLSIFLLMFIVHHVHSHCQIPCGIYDDQARINLMKEHVKTIEKSMSELLKDQNDNQTVRWVINKENHADELTDIITYYFMAQRIKPSSEKYEEKLTLLHQILINSMKAKQQIDLNVIGDLKSQLLKFEDLYFN